MDTQTRSDGTESRNAFSAPTALIEPPAWAAVDGYDIREVSRRTPTNDVFLAYHRPTGTFRELIVVERVPGVDQGALRQTIEAEVETARALAHVGVAAVEEVGLTRDGRLYVATARPVGRPLHTLLAEEDRLPVLRAFELGHTLVTAVAVAHEQGIVHGWLTPDSVIVVPPRAGWPERVVVLGFGTAAAQDAGLATDTFSGEQFPYMSPERAAGNPPSFRADVFGLGSLLLYMLMGSTPSVVRAPGAASEAADDNGVPGDIVELLRRARSVDPASRYASASELGAALWTVHNAWSAARSNAPKQDARAPAAGSSGRRRALIAAGVLGVFAAGAGVGARFWHVRSTAALEAPLVASTQSTAPSHVAAPATTAPTAGAEVASASVHGSDSVTAPIGHGDVASVRIATAPVQPSSAQPRTGRPQSAPPQSAPPESAPLARIEQRAPAAAIMPAPSIVAAPVAVTTSSTGDVAAASVPTVRSAGAGSTTPAATDVATADAGASDAAHGSRAGEVLATVADYGAAIGARDLGRLERLHPTMTEQQRRGWQTFFNSVSELRAPLTVEQITVAGATAQVRVRAAYEYENLRPHRAERSVVNYKLTLARDGGGWRIRAVE